MPTNWKQFDYLFDKEFKHFSDERLDILQDAMNAALENIILCDAYLVNVADSRPFLPLEPRYATIKALREYRRAKDSYNFDIAQYTEVVNSLEDERQNARSFIYGVFNRIGVATFRLTAFGGDYHYNVHDHRYSIAEEEA